MEVNRSSDHLGQLLRHRKERKPEHLIRVELHQNVNVTVDPEILAQNRSELRERTNVVSSAKGRECTDRHVEFDWLHEFSRSVMPFDAFVPRLP